MKSRRYIVLVAAVVFSFIIGLIFSSEKVDAATTVNHVYPNASAFVNLDANFSPNADSGNAYIEVSKVSAGNSLDAPHTAVDIFFQVGGGTGPKTITIASGKSCGDPDWQEIVSDGSRTTNFRLESWGRRQIVRSFDNAGSCASGANISFEVNIVPEDLYYMAAGEDSTKYYAFTLWADVAPGTLGGFVNAFKVRAAGAYVTIPENPGGTQYYFALQRRPGAGSGKRNFMINFTPDCGVRQSSPGIADNNRFMWIDDDWQTIEGGSTDYAIKVQRKPKTGTVWTDATISPVVGQLLSAGGGWWYPRTANGGYQSQGGLAISNMRVDHNYRVIWRGVSGENGIRFNLPYSAIGESVQCVPDRPDPVPTPVSATCRVFARIDGVAVNSGANAYQGSTVNVAVRSTNNGTIAWNNANNASSRLVYFHEGVPGPGAPEGSGRVHKYGENTVAPFDFNHPSVGPGQNSQMTARANLDTASTGERRMVYTVNHLTSFSGGVPVWQELARCEFVINVIPPPYVPDGYLSIVDCRNIQFFAQWLPARAQNLNAQVRIDYAGGTATASRTVSSGSTTTLISFNEAEFQNIPLHLGSYTVTLILEGEHMGTLSLQGAPCISLNCVTQAEYEAGSPNPYNLTYNVMNRTLRADNRYSIVVTAGTTPPNGQTIRRTLNTNGTPTSYVYQYNPTDGTSATGTLHFNDISLGSPALVASSCNGGGGPGGPDPFEVVTDVIVVRYPYIKAYGAEVMAGGGFGSTCSTRSGIFAMMRPMGQQVSTNKSGSGSQLGAFAFSQDGSSRISGFASAILRTSAPNATRGNALHFGGVNYDLNSRTPAMGGNLTGNPICMPDYFNDTQYPESNTTVRRQGDSTIQQTGLSNNYNGKQVFYEGNATVNYGGASTHQGRTTYYVEGNVQINSNVRYDGNYANVADIPNFTLIVKGNIYIAPNVTQLDGIYIAQPQEGNESTTGQIFTCARNYTAYTSASAVYTNCSGGYGGPYNTQSLRVNGSFIAQRIILNRAVNTLNNSTFREPQASSQAAEIFNYSPEIILSPPVFRPTGGPTGSSYESIGVLPPLL